MNKRIFPFLLALTVVTVLVTALNCGCAFAAEGDGMHRAAKSAAGHCGHETESAKSKQAPEECCSGCQLGAWVMDTAAFTADIQRAFHRPGGGVGQAAAAHTAFRFFLSPPGRTEPAAFFEAPAHYGGIPLYLLLQSFLI